MNTEQQLKQVAKSYDMHFTDHGKDYDKFPAYITSASDCGADKENGERKRMNSTIDWLLENENPAIKFRTMMEICGKALNECREAYDLIWTQKPIVNMLKKQDERGLWSTKDWGVHTSLRYLTAFAEYGIHKDERLDRFVDYTVDFLQVAERQGDLAGCANPLTLRALVMLGYHERDDVAELIAQFAAAQLADGGFMCKMKLGPKPGRKSCYKAALAGLLLYAECEKRNILPDNAEQLLDYFLKRDVFYASDKTKLIGGDGRPGWRFIDNFFPVEPMRMGLPLIMAALAVLGADDHPALAEAWSLLNDKEDENGKLRLEGTLTKQPCSFGKVGQENKWVTFYAVLAEKYRVPSTITRICCEGTMITLRNFTPADRDFLAAHFRRDMTLEQADALIAKWAQKRYQGAYFEQFAICRDAVPVGWISLYAPDPPAVGIGFEVIESERRKGYCYQAVLLALERARRLGYKTVVSTVRRDNTASIRLHEKCGFALTGERVNRRGNPSFWYGLEL